MNMIRIIDDLLTANKKECLYIALLIFLTGSTLGAPETVAAPRFSPILDGVVDEYSWSPITWIAGDNTVVAWVAWDPNYLYVSYMVEDSLLLGDSASYPWMSDGIEFYVDTQNDKTSYMEPGDFQFILTVVGTVMDARITTDGKDEAWSATGLRDDWVIDGSVNDGMSDTGYSVEVAIPWNSLSTTGFAGKELGMLLANNDAETSGTIQGSYGGITPFNRPIHWGTVTLIDSVLVGDVNNDGVVNLFDLVLVANNIGTQNLEYDLNGDGSINLFDLVVVVNEINNEPTGCQEDAKTCPDGSVVVRDPDLNCQFPSCPISTSECTLDSDCGTGEICENSVCIDKPNQEPTGIWTPYEEGPHATVKPLPLPDGPKIYIAPDGNDANSGTSSDSPLKTFEVAASKLSPGHTLVLLDGTYTVDSNGRPLFDCTSNMKSGVDGSPITIQAFNERKAFIKGDGYHDSFRLRNCEYIDVVGLRVEGANYVNRMPSLFQVEDSMHINLMRNILARTNYLGNSHSLLIVDSRYVLVEEHEHYYHHRHGLTISRSKDVTVRRYFSRDRFLEYVDGFYDYNSCRGGDEGIAIYPASNNLIENSIIEGVKFEELNPDKCTSAGSRSFGVHAGPSNGYQGELPGQNNRFLGLISIRAHLEQSTRLSSDGSLKPPHGNVFRDILLFGDDGLGTKYAFATRTGSGKIGSGGVLLDGLTVLDKGRVVTADEYQGYDGQQCADLPEGYECALTVKNSLAIGLDKIDTISGPYDKNFEYNNFYDVTTWPSESISDGSGSYRYNKNLAPSNLHPIPFYIPETSNMKGAGAGGKDIGANILYRYENGVLTDEPLWDPATGRFPCGAIVPGLNDLPGESCYDVHERLQVTPDTLPPSYG